MKKAGIARGTLWVTGGLALVLFEALQLRSRGMSWGQIGLVTVGGFAVLLMLALPFSIRQQMAVSRVASARPGCHVVPGFATSSMRQWGRSIGRMKMNALGSQQFIVLVAVPGGVEVWNKRGDGVLWVIPTSIEYDVILNGMDSGEATGKSIMLRGRDTQGNSWIADFIPAYGRAYSLFHVSARGLRRAAAALNPIPARA